MPEGPELRQSRDALQQFLGLRVLAAVSLGGRYTSTLPAGFAAWQADGPLGCLLEVEVKGKFMWWRFGRLEDPPSARWHLFCTYGMTGGWTTLEATYPAFVFRLEADVRLTFDDMRRFGTLKFVKGQDALDRKLLSLGPDMLERPPSPEEFALRILRRPRATLAEALMDQGTVSGIGNYLKAEIAYRAGVSPWRRVCDLTVEELVAIHDACVTVPKQSYEARGVHLSDYRDVDGHVTSEFQRMLLVYDRQQCPLGHSVLSELTGDGRTSWWCPSCQR